MVDVFGSMFLERTDLFQLPFEAQAGLRFYPFARSSFSITAGAGAPLSPGMGVGRFRVFVSLLWSRSKEVFADTDRDGLADFKDDCPRRYGSLSNRGCPWPDKDGDGTDDRMDRCPVVRGPIKNYGCPWPDTDGDGLADNEDRCPRRQGALKNEGCPWPDKDGDGLANHEDRCPAESGPRHNRGCPVQVQRVVHKVQVLPLVQQKLPSLYFAFNHWGLHKTTTFKLRTILRHLRRFPRHQLVLEGYADSPGTRDYNLWLSRKRALAVMTRLLRAGISPKRLSVRGMGNQASLLLVRKKRRQARFRRVDFVIVQKEPAS
jgi:outer membrane protein OmpA-like peptidoglycan-associated protein